MLCCTYVGIGREMDSKSKAALDWAGWCDSFAVRCIWNEPVVINITNRRVTDLLMSGTGL